MKCLANEEMPCETRLNFVTYLHSDDPVFAQTNLELELDLTPKTHLEPSRVRPRKPILNLPYPFGDLNIVLGDASIGDIGDGSIIITIMI